MIKVIKVKDLVELLINYYNIEAVDKPKKSYKLLRVIDVNGNTVPSVNELEAVIESVEIES